MGDLRIKRIYSDPTPDDGYRILVDRLWPRGISKERAALAEWAREIAPSSELRKTFRPMAEHVDQFTARYLVELDHNLAAQSFAERIQNQLAEGNVTLLYASKDVEHNHAIILKKWLAEQLS